MRHGMPPKEAILDALKRVARNFNNDMELLAKVGLDFYCVRKDGEYASGSLWGPVNGRGPQFAVCMADGNSRHEQSVYLFEHKKL
jgi:N4-(beta-N-acetylglucosaminyl)-L-asparaginase